MKNQAAVALGKMGKGVKRRFTAETIKQSTDRIQRFNQERKAAKSRLLLEEAREKKLVEDRAKMGLFTPIQ